MTSLPRPDAVVLAGGLARRMGGRPKGLIELGDRPMLAHVIEAIAPAVGRIVLNANAELERHAALGPAVVTDGHPDHPGPLAGLAAGLDTLNADRVFMCPCDSPFVTAALVATLDAALLAAPESVGVVAAHDGDRLQPVFAIVRRRCRASLEAWLAAGERKIDRWYDTVGLLPVDCRAHVAAFRNINTDADLAEANAALARATAASMRDTAP